MAKCGNKQAHGGVPGEHATVEEVRACYAKRYQQEGRTPAADVEQSDVDRLTEEMLSSRRASGPMWPATDKQIAYVLGLQDERLLPDNWLIYDEEQLRSKEKDEVSAIITVLKALPRGNDGRSRKWNMPEGRYALSIEYTDDEWWFFEVSQPDQGRWAGYTFIKRLIGSPGDYKRVEMPKHQREAMLDEIDKDPKQAMLNYGLHSGVCGMCGSPLSNAESLARGIGPICAGKMGW